MSDEKDQIFTEIGAMTAMIERIVILALKAHDEYQCIRILEEAGSLKRSLRIISDNASAIKEAPNDPS